MKLNLRVDETNLKYFQQSPDVESPDAKGHAEASGDNNDSQHEQERRYYEAKKEKDKLLRNSHFAIG